jgi:hypothetical protein
MRILAILLTLLFTLPAAAQPFDPDRRVVGCFGGNDRGLDQLNRALGRVTEFSDMFSPTSRKLISGGDCWWHDLSRYGDVDRYWQGFHTANGWIFPRWLEDIIERSPESDIYWSDESFLIGDWRIGRGRQCTWEQRGRFDECLVPRDRDLARNYITWKRNNGQTIPPYVSIPSEWLPQ